MNFHTLLNFCGNFTTPFLFLFLGFHLEIRECSVYDVFVFNPTSFLSSANGNILRFFFSFFFPPIFVVTACDYDCVSYVSGFLGGIF